jgi:hypothetical protein
VILSVTRCDNGKTPRATVTVGRMKDGEEGDAWTLEVQTMEVGVDRNGNLLHGGYVVITEPPARTERAAKAKEAKLSPAAKIALDALTEALVNVGKQPPVSTHIPNGVKNVVTSEQWRTIAYRRGISSGEARAKQRAFGRAVITLQNAGRIGCWDDNVWIVPR